VGRCRGMAGRHGAHSLPHERLRADTVTQALPTARRIQNCNTIT
jgi:hypothetical protein